MALLQAISDPIVLLLNGVLIVVLVARELMNGAQSFGAQRVRGWLSIARLPVVALLVGTVVVKLGSLGTQTTPAQATTALLAAASLSPTTGSTASTPTPSPTVVPPTATVASTPTVVPLAAATSAAPPSKSPGPSPSTTPIPSGVATGATPIDISLAAWPRREGTTAQLRYADNSYQLVLAGQQNVGITSQVAASNYRTVIDISITEGEAGVVFLATEPDTFYRIMLNTQGAYAIQELYANNEVQNVVDWTNNDALQSATTQLRIERQGDAVQFVANDQLLTTFTVPNPSATNQIGVALTSPTGQGQVTFRNLVVEELTNVSR